MGIQARFSASELRGIEWYFLWARCQEHGEAAILSHDMPVKSMTFFPDSQTLATASGRDTSQQHFGRIEVWDVSSRRRLRSFRTSDGTNPSVAVSPDGILIAASDVFGKQAAVSLWDVSTGKCVRRFFGHTDRVATVAFSPDGKLLASGGVDYTARLWDVDSGKLLHTCAGHVDKVLGVAFAPDGSLLATASRDHLVKLWSVERGAEVATLTAHTAPVRAVLFSHDGHTLASGGAGHEIILWDTHTFGMRMELDGHTNYVRGLAFSLDDRILIAGDENNTVTVWSTANGELLATMRDHASDVNAVALSSDGRLLASGSTDRTVMIHQMSRFAEGDRIDPGTLWATNVRFADVGGQTALIVTRHCDTPGHAPVDVDVWNVGTQQRQRFAGHEFSVLCAAVSPSGKLLAAGGWTDAGTVWSGEIALWNVKTGTLRGILPDEAGPVMGLAFLDEERLVSGAFRGGVKLWNLRNANPMTVLVEPGFSTAAMTISENRKLLAAGGGWQDEGQIRVWDTETWNEVHLDGHTRMVYCLAFAPDGQTLISGAWDDTVRRWDARRGYQIAPTLEHALWIPAVAPSRDGKTLLTADGDGMLRFWDTATNDVTASIWMKLFITSMAFSPDGDTLALGLLDQSVELWHRDGRIEMLRP